MSVCFCIGQDRNCECGYVQMRRPRRARNGRRAMTSHDNHKPRGQLDRAIAALQATPIPDGPPPRLVASTLAALPSGTGSPATIHTQERRRDMFRFVTYSGAVAAAIIAAIAGLVFFLDSRPQLAFADVIKNVSDSKSVTFITKMPT